MSVVFENISFSYGTNQILRDFSLTIGDGAFFGICGKTGCGKSTLVKLLNGLLKPDCGKITIDGVDTRQITSLYRKVGLVFQYPEYQLFEQTVLKDIMFGPLNTGLCEEDARQAARKAMADLDLMAELEERSPFELSGGERRRVAIAGVLAMDVDILVLDEPAAALDPVGHDMLFELLKKLNAMGKTIIIVSHEKDDIFRYCSSFIALDDSSEDRTSTLQDIAAALRENGFDAINGDPSEDELVSYLKSLR